MSQFSNPQDRWVDEKYVAMMTGLSLSTLRKYRHYGKGPAYVKVGRSVRYSLTDIHCFMTEKRIQPCN